ncbi:MAG: phytoene/squalene synthase family protein [Crocinitomicaceae bacterium]|nr:phytoene/squalene synthase family protein [Crocinitomicaceae bacterium]
MKHLFDEYSEVASKLVTKRYSTSFYAGVKCLGKDLRADVHNIYGFVRFADEIVDSFHDYNKEELFNEFKSNTYSSIERGISLNPILNSFQATVNKFNIDIQLIDQFLHSMEMDLSKIEYNEAKYDEYILGSAEVVGLMCLKVFVQGDEEEYEKLKPSAMTLGSAFQKINFLRDIKDDINNLGRVYFPNVDSDQFSDEDKKIIEVEIQKEFDEALLGIKMLPKPARFGVFLSYSYYEKLLQKIKGKSASGILKERVRIPGYRKLIIFYISYFKNIFNLI